MGLFATFFYAEGFYGSAEFGVLPGGPANLNAYQNNIDTVVLYWTLNPAEASIHSFVWVVETDTDDSFASPDLRTYVTTDSRIELVGALVTGNTISVDVDGNPVSTLFATDSNTTLAALAALIAAEPGVASATVVDAGSGTDDDRVIVVRSADIEAPAVLSALSVTGGATQTTGSIGQAVDFIAGRIHKGVAVPIYTRQQGETSPMHWRVTGVYGGIPTNTVVSEFTIPQAIDEVVRDNGLSLMPDPIYKKSADSNNYNVHWVFGKALDDHYVANVFAENDIGLDLVRDATIQNKFGDMVLITRPQTMKAIDFREIIKQFFVEARNSPSVRSVRNMVRACLNVEPTLTPIRDTLALQVADDTLGQEVEEFWVPDEGYYQSITFDGPLVTGNTYTIDVDSVPVATPFNTDSDTTMQDIADNIAAEPSVSFAAVVKVAGADNDRVIIIQAAVPSTPPSLTNSLVTGGASQAGTVVVPEGHVLPETVWDNIHLAGGIIVEVTNPLGAIVSKAFLQYILRKLVMAHFPLYVTGIP